MAKEKIENSESKTRKKFNNNVHLHGYINDVRLNTMEKGRTAINLDVATVETYKNKNNEFVNNRTYHDVVIFTDKKEVVDKFSAIAADVKANKENKENKDYKPKTHTVSLDGILVNKENSIKDSDVKYQSLQVLVKDDAFKADVKQADNEVRNRTEIVGNIASIKLYEDKGFAIVTVMNHYRPEDSEKEFGTTLQVRVDAERPYSEKTYKAIKEGGLKVGDFIRVGGQLHNNNFEIDGVKRFGMALDVTSSEVIKKKAEKAEVNTETKKPEPKKAEPKKKATSRKKGQSV